MKRIVKHINERRVENNNKKSNGADEDEMGTKKIPMELTTITKRIGR